MKQKNPVFLMEKIGKPENFFFLQLYQIARQKYIV